jgi:5'-3' exonuclease
MAVIHDISGFLHRYVHVKKHEILCDYNTVANMMFEVVSNDIVRFGISKSNPLVVAVDSKPYWRSQYYNENCRKFPEYYDTKKEEWKTYKGGRSKDPDFDWNKIHKVFSYVLKTLDCCTDVRVIEVPTAEADDVIYIASKYYQNKGQPTIIVTCDKDINQCQVVGEIEIYDPMKKIFIPTINKERFMKLHLICGDKGDNIAAIKPRVAEKTAVKMYDTITETLLTNPDMNERYLFNQVLIDFKHIPEDLYGQVTAKLEESHDNYHAMNLLKCFQRLDCQGISSNMRRFKFVDREVKTELNNILNIHNKNEKYHDSLLDKFFE